MAHYQFNRNHNRKQSKMQMPVLTEEIIRLVLVSCFLVGLVGGLAAAYFFG